MKNSQLPTFKPQQKANTSVKISKLLKTIFPQKDWQQCNHSQFPTNDRGLKNAR
jgi:hypothetical protein